MDMQTPQELFPSFNYLYSKHAGMLTSWGMKLGLLGKNDAMSMAFLAHTQAASSYKPGGHATPDSWFKTQFYVLSTRESRSPANRANNDFLDSALDSEDGEIAHREVSDEGRSDPARAHEFEEEVQASWRFASDESLLAAAEQHGPRIASMVAASCAGKSLQNHRHGVKTSQRMVQRTVKQFAETGVVFSSKSEHFEAVASAAADLFWFADLPKRKFEKRKLAPPPKKQDRRVAVIRELFDFVECEGVAA